MNIFYFIMLTAANVRADDTDVVEHVRPEPRPEWYRRQNCGRFRASAFVRNEKETVAGIKKNKIRTPVNTRNLRDGVSTI